jgi:haloalkane dehalogenase
VTAFARTDDSHFEALDDWPYEPHYHQWKDLRVHYVDVGPADGPVMLLMHGMPTWGYLYRTMIPGLVDAGYRCIAPDHLGFGRSDKPTDANWYSIARHTEVLTSLITALDLDDVTLVCQDWGGPIGLAQAATMPERLSRLVIMNTWLHHPGYEYTDAIRNWMAAWHEGGLFHRERPNVALVLLLSARAVDPAVVFGALTTGGDPELTGDAAAMYAGFAAPFRGLADDAYNGLRMFPLSIPADDYDSGNGAAQTMHYNALLGWDKPVHFVWGGQDDVFTEAWGRTWAERMGASFDLVPDAHHFLQNTHGPTIVDHVLRRIGEEGGRA